MRHEDIVVGESYKIRDWNDMIDEFGASTTSSGSIYINMPNVCFVESMRVLCGKEVVVSKKYRSVLGSRFVRLQDLDGWTFSCDMLEPVDDTLNIHIDMNDFIENILK